jgi:hypothetical protein
MRLIRDIFLMVLLGFTSQSAVADRAKEGTGDNSYAINLASTQRDLTAYELPHLDILHTHRVYTVSFVKDGKSWQRLRLGFFNSRSEANSALDELKADYPDAWIAEVSADERRNASGPVIAASEPRTVMQTGNAASSEEKIPPAERLAFAGAESGDDDGSQDYSKPVSGSSKPIVVTQTETQSSPEMRSSRVDRLALAGAEYGDKNAYVYAGLLVPFPGSNLGNGFIQRYWLDWLQYEYDAGERTIKAKAPGASVALGYGKAVEAGAWSVYLGPVWRNTDLSPDDRDSDVRGTQWGMNLSLQGNRKIGDDWRVNGIASFTTGTDSYWTRGRITRKLLSGYAAGLEVVVHGNDDYSAWQAGAVLLDIRLSQQVSLGLKGGARESSGEDMGAYLGVELARSF